VRFHCQKGDWWTKLAPPGHSRLIWWNGLQCRYCNATSNPRSTSLSSIGRVAQPIERFGVFIIALAVLCAHPPLLPPLPILPFQYNPRPQQSAIAKMFRHIVPAYYEVSIRYGLLLKILFNSQHGIHLSKLSRHLLVNKTGIHSSVYLSLSCLSATHQPFPFIPFRTPTSRPEPALIL
jgi:hypothetical protein